ncbi:MAG: hypothetical protein AAB372_03400 [Patescibacteria group bacterium]
MSYNGEKEDVMSILKKSPRWDWIDTLVIALAVGAAILALLKK